MPEAKEVQDRTLQKPNQDFDEKADTFEWPEEEKETPPSPSEEKKPEGEKTETEKSATAEVEKTEQIKEVEADTSLSVEEKIGKVKEILGDDLDAIDAYVKEKGYHKDPAWQKQREIISRLKAQAQEGALSDEDRALIEEVKSVVSSREYIQAAGKAQGLTQEKINENLKTAGFETEEGKVDDMELVAKGLGVTLKALEDEGTKDIAESVAKIARIVAAQVIKETLPAHLGDLKADVSQITQQSSATRLAKEMQAITAKDEVLDFKKDIEPALNSYLDKNPTASQQEVFNHFKEIYPSLAIARLKTVGRKTEREGKKEELRQPVSRGINIGKLPPRTGDYSKDAENYFASIGYNE